MIICVDNGIVISHPWHCKCAFCKTDDSVQNNVKKNVDGILVLFLLIQLLVLCQGQEKDNGENFLKGELKNELV